MPEKKKRIKKSAKSKTQKGVLGKKLGHPNGLKNSKEKSRQELGIKNIKHDNSNPKGRLMQKKVYHLDD